MSENPSYLSDSPIYDPVAVLRRDEEVVIVARVGMKSSQRFMVLTPAGDPAWLHEPLASLSDVAWSLRAHQWHLVQPDAAGHNGRPAKTLARLLAERT